jgi:hypothetical protein
MCFRVVGAARQRPHEPTCPFFSLYRTAPMCFRHSSATSGVSALRTFSKAAVGACGVHDTGSNGHAAVASQNVRTAPAFMCPTHLNRVSLAIWCWRGRVVGCLLQVLLVQDPPLLDGLGLRDTRHTEQHTWMYSSQHYGLKPPAVYGFGLLTGVGVEPSCSSFSTSGPCRLAAVGSLLAWPATPGEDPSPGLPCDPP